MTRVLLTVLITLCLIVPTNAQVATPDEDLKIPSSMSPYGLVPALNRIVEAIKARPRAVTNEEELRRAISEKCSPIYLAAGTMNISDTIKFPVCDGYTIQGAGVAKKMDGTQHRGPSTILNWTGEPGKPMFEYEGMGAYISGFSIQGNTTGFQFVKDAGVGGPMGTGKICIPHIGGIYCESVLKFGRVGDSVEEWTRNCDNVLVGFLDAQFCNRAVRMCTPQAVSVHFQYIHSYFTKDCMIRSDWGNTVWVHAADVTQPQTLLSIGYANSVANTYYLGGLNLDIPFMGGKLVTVDEDNCMADIWIDNCRFPPTKEDISGYGPWVELKSGCSLTIRDSKGLPPNLKEKDSKGRLAIYNSRMGYKQVRDPETGDRPIVWYEPETLGADIIQDVYKWK